MSSDTYNRYNRTPVTPDPTFPNDDKIDHKWPSRNNRGDTVWSQKDPNNPSAPWQVWEQPSGGIRKQITFDQHSHERPVISDNGAIAWFQDSTGGGLGYAIMRLDPGSNSPSTIEYSSRKLCQTIYDSTGHPISSTCAPPQDAQEHDAGKNFGFSSDGRTISYFTFFDNGDPTDRPFDINGQPLKDNSGNKVEFIGYDSPDLNANSALVYSDDFRGLGSIYLATTTQPFSSTIIDGPGNPQQDGAPKLPTTNRAAPPLAQYPHIADGQKPEVVYLKNKVNINHWPGKDPANWVDLGSWGDVAGSGSAAMIAYERVVNGHSQIWLAKPVTTGAINVMTDEPTATFMIAGAMTFTGGGMSFSQPTAPPGTYTITFGAITGFATPPPQTQTLLAGGSINFTGLYRSSLKVLSGDKQRNGIAGQALPNPLVVKLTDQTGAPVPNIRVSFSITQQPTGVSGTLSATNTTSAPDGTARTQLTLGTVAGQYQVTASCPDLNCTPQTVLFTEGTPPGAILLDPVPDLLAGPAVTIDTTLLSSSGRTVNGVAADGVSQLVVRITGALPNEHFQLSIDTDGALANIGTNNFQPTTTVQADASANAFALYQAPTDFVRSLGIDDSAASRTVNLTIQSLDNPGITSTTPITIVRPLVMLIHGIWSDPTATWGTFTPLNPQGQPTRFTIATAEYDTPGLISASTPSYSSGVLQKAKTNALGFAFNAPLVMNQMQVQLEVFRNGGNQGAIPVAAIQADVVAHSLGGDISRAIVLQPGFLGDTTFNQGIIHKLITIDTPHLGTPLAIDILQDTNSCVRTVLAQKGNVAFQTAVTPQGTFNGAALDLQGDGTGIVLSDALKQLQNSNPHPLPTAVLAGVMNSSNLSGLDNNASTPKIALHGICGIVLKDPLGLALTSTGWRSVFNDDNDGIVPLTSQLNGLRGISPVAGGYVHSTGTELLGFSGPSVLDPGTFANHVIDLLNAPLSNQAFNQMKP